jgi:hypothetical protein
MGKSASKLNNRVRRQLIVDGRRWGWPHYPHANQCTEMSFYRFGPSAFGNACNMSKRKKPLRDKDLTDSIEVIS